jgi:hypothetical protein
MQDRSPSRRIANVWKPLESEKLVKTKSGLLIFAAYISLAACGSPSQDTSAPAAAANGAAHVGKVSANTASKTEIVAALTGVGVPNPQRWANEVMEYRPYAANDSDLTRLRENLIKHKPGQQTVDKIVSALTP